MKVCRQVDARPAEKLVEEVAFPRDHLRLGHIGKLGTDGVRIAHEFFPGQGETGQVDVHHQARVGVLRLDRMLGVPDQTVDALRAFGGHVWA